MDRLHDLALEIAQHILAARTEAESYELGVSAENTLTEDLVELAKQLLAEENRRVNSTGWRLRDPAKSTLKAAFSEIWSRGNRAD